MNSMIPIVEWCDRIGAEHLRFTFGEYLTERDADFAILKWKEVFNQKKGKSVSLIWDCTKMKGYDSGARQKWTNTLFELKTQIRSILLISDSTIVRMGASVMSMATSLQIQAVNNEHDAAI